MKTETSWFLEIFFDIVYNFSVTDNIHDIFNVWIIKLFKKIYQKNYFAETCKNLAKYKNLKIIF